MKLQLGTPILIFSLACLPVATFADEPGPAHRGFLLAPGDEGSATAAATPDCEANPYICAAVDTFNNAATAKKILAAAKEKLAQISQQEEANVSASQELAERQQDIQKGRQEAAQQARQAKAAQNQADKMFPQTAQGGPGGGGDPGSPPETNPINPAEMPKGAEAPTLSFASPTAETQLPGMGGFGGNPNRQDNSSNDDSNLVSPLPDFSNLLGGNAYRSPASEPVAGDQPLATAAAPVGLGRLTPLQRLNDGGGGGGNFNNGQGAQNPGSQNQNAGIMGGTGSPGGSTTGGVGFPGGIGDAIEALAEASGIKIRDGGFGGAGSDAGGAGSEEAVGDGDGAPGSPEAKLASAAGPAISREIAKASTKVGPNGEPPLFDAFHIAFDRERKTEFVKLKTPKGPSRDDEASEQLALAMKEGAYSPTRERFR